MDWSFWYDKEAPSNAAPAVKVIVTKSGHKILLDDGGAKITITDRNNNSIALSSDGITLQRGGEKIAISNTEVSVNNGALEIS